MTRSICYTESTPVVRNSIFLAGPTSRKPLSEWKGDDLWRQDAILILTDLKFNGDVFVPEYRFETSERFDTREDMYSWEQNGLERADCILFWVPRSRDLPAFTTNQEWGAWKGSGKAVLGYPDYATKMHYMHWHADRCGVSVYHDLREACMKAMSICGQ